MEPRVVNRRFVLAVIIVGSIFLLTAGAAIAAGAASDGVAPAGKSASAPGGSVLAGTSAISQTDHMTGGQMIAGCIATLFDVPISDVVTLRSEGYGFGEVAKAYFLAAAGGLTVDDILELREGDMGWGEIAQYLGLPPSNRDRNLGQIISGRLQVSGTVSLAAQRLAERLGATPEEVAALMEEGASRGTIIVAYKLAGKLEGATADDLVGQRLAGSNWGQIKRGWTAPTTSVGATQGKPEHGGRPDHAGPPEGKGPPDHAGPKKNNGNKK